MKLLAPRSVAVVGATERPGAYGSAALLNLRRLGFAGPVYAVNPRRSSVHGYPCFGSLSDLPEPVDAVAIAVPAAAVGSVIEEAGSIGCGGAVVFAAGFEEAGAAALQASLPVCGPNGNGIVALPERVALWGDLLSPREAGSVALVTQSGNVAVNALASRTPLHTVVSCGNAAVLSPADYVEALARRDGVRSIAVYLEDDGRGEDWKRALLACAEARVPVTVLKAGSSPTGAAAAQAHTGAIAGDQRAVRALFETCGATWAEDPHDLLELATALSCREGGDMSPASRHKVVGVMTCSGGDSAVAADVAAEIGLPLEPPRDEEALRGLLPAAATVANPLDYTSLLWDDTAALARLRAAFEAQYDLLLVLFDQADDEWDAVLEALRGPKTLVASTLPALAPEDAVAGLRTGVRAAKALAAPGGDAERIKALETRRFTATTWLTEHETKLLLSDAVPKGRLVYEPEEIEGPVVVKASGAALRHKSAVGGVRVAPDDVRGAIEELLRFTGEVLVEELIPPGPEMFVAVRTDTIVPVLVVGFGGAMTEAIGKVKVLTLPVTEAEVPTDRATARLAVQAVEVALHNRLALLELNPVVRGIALDAVAAVQGGGPA